MADLGSAFMAPLLQNQQLLERQQMAPAELAQRAASTRLTSAEAERMEVMTAGEKRVAVLMAQQAGNGQPSADSGTISSKLLGMSDLYAQAGMPTMAAKLAQQASASQAHEATARAAQVRQQLQNFQLKKGQIDMVTKLLDGAKDADSWAAANATFKQETGQDSPFADTPYDPKLVQVLKDSAMTEYQRQMAAMRKTALGADLANKASAIRSRATRDSIAEARLNISKQREARLSKAGGKDIGSPSKVELEAATRLIGDSLEGDELDNAAFSIASSAKVMRRKNPGMSSDEALRQALLGAQQSGEIVPGKPGGIFGIGKTPGKFAIATPLPKTKDQLKVGSHYTFPNGEVYEWTGAKKGDPWKKVGKGAAPPDDNEEDDDESDD